MKKAAIIQEFFAFLKETKAWWMAPIIIIIILLSLVIIFTEGSAVAPLIYTIF